MVWASLRVGCVDLSESVLSYTEGGPKRVKVNLQLHRRLLHPSHASVLVHSTSPLGSLPMLGLLQRKIHSKSAIARSHPTLPQRGPVTRQRRHQCRQLQQEKGIVERNGTTHSPPRHRWFWLLGSRTRGRSRGYRQ